LRNVFFTSRKTFFQILRSLIDDVRMGQQAINLAVLNGGDSAIPYPLKTSAFLAFGLPLARTPSGLPRFTD
jgi:hypothetical protein